MSRSRANRRGGRTSAQTADLYLVAPTAPVYYLLVLLQGEVIGYLWASEDKDSVGFFRRKGARRRDTARAGTIWSHRLRDAEADGLKPSHILHLWVGKREDAEAGGVPADISQQHGDTTDMLRNHGSYSPPVRRGPPPPGWMSWD